MKEKQEFYSLDKILELNANINMIVGERSNGKSYAALKRALERYWNYGLEFAYVRRYHKNINENVGVEIFNNLIANGEISKITRGEYNTIYYRAGQFRLSKIDEETGKRETAENICGYGMALEDCEEYKSRSYPNIGTIIFDEFATRKRYIYKEQDDWESILSTIMRKKDKDHLPEIFMLANTVNIYCPYYEFYGLKNAKDSKPGTIELYQYKSGLTIAYEHTPHAIDADSDKYFNHNENSRSMIIYGDYEMETYPKLPAKYTDKQVLYTFYVCFDNECLICDIVMIGGGESFIYIRKSKHNINVEGFEVYALRKENEIIFVDKNSPNKYIRRNFLKPYDKISQKILRYYQTDNIYYEDDLCGEIMRNYINTCKDMGKD